MQVATYIKRKAFTLVEMLVALAVSSIIVGAAYSSYQMVATQYKKNMDVAEMHTSGRAIMRIIERDVRMAGFEYRDKDAKVTYGTISNPLEIKDSGNKCCDEVTVVYDYYDEEAKKAQRIRIRYWAELYTSNKGSRYRLYKQKDILGENKKILTKPKLGSKEVMADYIEDLQISDAGSTSTLTNSSCDYSKVCEVYNGLKVHAEKVKIDQQNRLKKDPKSNLMSRR
ncbi:MAG: prepilin-type N-terminal cleavage/methylation domain-containing protein, partial [Candidatus Brocadiales bacterium]|nr:prepilin-type N-terminal cleavage/methylation domain-containing protein [Candidatus Brocadiales bacterium]